MATTPYTQLPRNTTAAQFTGPIGSAEHYTNARGIEITRRDYNRLRERDRLHQPAPPERAIKVTTEDRYYKVIDRLAQGERLASASRAEGINPETVKRLNAERETYQTEYHQKRQPNGSTRPTTAKGYRVGSHPSTPIITKNGVAILGPSVDSHYSSLLGRYHNAVDAALEHQNSKTLQAFAGQMVYTTDGNRYELMTDSNDLYDFFQRMSEDEQDDFWRNFYKGASYAITA